MSALLRGALHGAVLGLGWGLGARIWMRAISTDPAFTWSGTLLILGFATWLGIASGLLAGARSTGRRPWWALLGAPGLVLFASPGLLFLPAVAAGGLAFSTRAPGWRAVGWAAVAIPVALVTMAALREPFTHEGSLLFAVSGSCLLSLGLARLGAPVWARPVDAQADETTTWPQVRRGEAASARA